MSEATTETMCQKLLPCPFCGKSVAHISTSLQINECEECSNDNYRTVICDFNKGGCGAISGYFETEQKAIDLWNSRAIPNCSWTEDSDGTWNTHCGNDFQFNDGGPEENGQRFCGYCGHKLIAIKFDEEIDNDE